MGEAYGYRITTYLKQELKFYDEHTQTRSQAIC